MQTGKLRHRVTMQQKTMIQDSEGMTTETWSDVVTVWAAVEPLTGREFFNAAAVNAEVNTRIMIRYHSGIQPAMRAVLATRTFDIKSVIDVGGRKRELELMCQEAV